MLTSWDGVQEIWANHGIFQLQLCFSWNYWNPTGAISCDEFGIFKCLQLVLYQVSHLRPKNFKAEIWKGPSFKNDEKGQQPVFLGPLEIVWFTSLLVSIFVSLILSSIWLMFSLVAPGVKDSLVTFSFSSWNMFLSPCFASILMRKVLPCRMPCGRCIQSKGLPLAPWRGQNGFETDKSWLWLPVQWDWTGSYRRWWVFLIMNFGLTRWCLLYTK